MLRLLIHGHGILLCGFVAGLLLPGCSRSNEAPATAAAAQTNADTAADPDSSSAEKPTARKTHRRDELWEDEKGQKWFGNVPLDAFFDQPYEVASNQTPIGGEPVVAVAANTVAGTDSASAVEPEMTEEPAAAASAATPSAASESGDGSWADLVSTQTLDDEVKTIRNFMNENLQSVGSFNSSMLMLPPKAATLGALAGVAMELPDAVSWKDDAKYVRNLAKKMNESALQRGAKDQKRMLELYEAVSDTLNRSKPAGLEEPPDTDSFADVSEMRLLMMRMEEAEKRIKTEAGTESAMGSKKDLVSHEASMIGVMARIVTLPGYGYEDDAEFKGFAEEIVTASLSIKTSVTAGDFATYEGALSKIATTCQNCHSKFKND